MGNELANRNGKDLSMQELAEEIKQAHAMATTHGLQTIEHALRVGQLLTEAKSRCEHGKWIAWLDGNFEFDQRTASTYMRCYQNRDKLAVLSNRKRASDLSIRTSERLLSYEKPAVKATLDEIPKSVRESILAGKTKATDAQIKALAGADEAAASQVARDIRTGKQPDLGKAMQAAGIKAPKRKPKSSGKPLLADLGRCPVCLSTKWDEDEDGIACSKCHQPYGEAAGEVDDSRVSIQRSKTVKTAEALMRAFDDLNQLKPKAEHKPAIAACKGLLILAKGWK